jgi:hypothetical protein
MIVEHFLQRLHGYHARGWSCLSLLLGCLLCVISCNSGGDTGTPPEDSAFTDEQFVWQGAMEVLDLYRTALMQEDIDRLQALLQPPRARAQPDGLLPQRHGEEEVFADAQTFREAMTVAFRTHTITDLQIPPETIQIVAHRLRVMFQEVESGEDSITLVQWTRVFRTTLQLTRGEAAGVVTFRIGGVQRVGPLVEITTLGQSQAGALTRVYVEGSDDPFILAGGAIEGPERGRCRNSWPMGPDGRRSLARHTRLPPDPSRSGCAERRGKKCICTTGIGCGSGAET